MWGAATGLEEEEAAEKPYIASMGIYVFKKDVLLKLLKKSGDTDFGGQVIPGAARDHKVQAYLFNDYWEDIGTIKTFFEANLALAEMVRLQTSSCTSLPTSLNLALGKREIVCSMWRRGGRQCETPIILIA